MDISSPQAAQPAKLLTARVITTAIICSIIDIEQTLILSHSEFRSQLLSVSAFLTRSQLITFLCLE